MRANLHTWTLETYMHACIYVPGTWHSVSLGTSFNTAEKMQENRRARDVHDSLRQDVRNARGLSTRANKARAWEQVQLAASVRGSWGLYLRNKSLHQVSVRPQHGTFPQLVSKPNSPHDMHAKEALFQVKTHTTVPDALIFIV